MPNFEPNDDAKMAEFLALLDEGDACDPATDIDGEEFMEQMRQRIADRAKGVRDLDHLKDWVPEGMEHSAFEIGKTFICGGRQWRCTDIGTRTIIGICLENIQSIISSGDPAVEPNSRTLTPAEAEKEGWFIGPPYKVVETVFDEYDIQGCSPDREAGTGDGEGYAQI
jgi:hypothetical protein